MDTAKALPMSLKECRDYGYEELDFVYVIGDAYIDHPSFGPAIISRVLQDHGYRVGIISQPDWHDTTDFKRLGKPRLGFLVSAGNMDSLVNHYTVAKRHRSTDAYTEGGKTGRRPDRATIVYANRIREAFKGEKLPIIIGGIEASLRRFAHYDYWDDRVRQSILVDSGADLLIYGMGEKPIVEIADALAGGLSIGDITYVNGTCYLAKDLERVYAYTLIESAREVSGDKKAYCRAFMAQYTEQDALRGKRLVQPHDKGYLVQNPPALPLTAEELDHVYELPYTRKPHPAYKGHIPALDEVEFSLASCRGCFGGCHFCALTFHQGRVVQARSRASLVKEARLLSTLPNFKGYIHDVGGPTANFRQPACKKQLQSGTCPQRECLGYSHCKNLEGDHKDYVTLLRELRKLPGIKKVFVRSGIRYDYAMFDKDDSFLHELVAHHVSGQLKVAPEHVSEEVLYFMGKPGHGLYDRFVQRYRNINKKLGMEQFIVPYFMSSHPGSDLQAAVELALYLKKSGQRPEQVQDFYPTPGTLSTCMYYTELDPRNMKPVYVPKDPEEKAMQRALMQYFLPQYRDKARAALLRAGREDLIGTDRDCLLPPAPQRKPPRKEDGKLPQRREKASRGSKGQAPSRSGKKPAGSSSGGRKRG